MEVGDGSPRREGAGQVLLIRRERSVERGLHAILRPCEHDMRQLRGSGKQEALRFRRPCVEAAKGAGHLCSALLKNELAIGVEPRLRPSSGECGIDWGRWLRPAGTREERGRTHEPRGDLRTSRAHTDLQGGANGRLFPSVRDPCFDSRVTPATGRIRGDLTIARGSTGTCRRICRSHRRRCIRIAPPGATP